MIIEQLAPELLTQFIGEGKVEYNLVEGVVYDRSHSITTVTTTSGGIFDGGHAQQTANSESWIKWNTPDEPDMVIRIPDFVVGHQVAILGATGSNDRGRSVNIPHLVIWNLNTRKGYILQKFAPSEKTSANKSDDPFDQLSACCLTPRDQKFMKLTGITAVISILLVSTLAYIETRKLFSILVSFVCVGIPVLAAGNFLSGQAKKMITDRVYVISKAMKCDLFPKA